MSFSQNFELTLEKLSENDPYLELLVILMQNLDIDMVKTLIFLREFQLKI